MSKISTRSYFLAKQKGFADRQIAYMLDCVESEVYKLREKFNINRVYKLVDTCAAEFQAKTPYYYSTFEAEMKISEKFLLLTMKARCQTKRKLLF